MEILIVRSTERCVVCSPIQIDPYWREVAEGRDWNELARGDGHSYGGVVDTLQLREGESPEQLEARAQARVVELQKIPWNRCMCLRSCL